MDKAPVFVKIEDYKDIVDLLALIKDRLKQSKFLLDKVKEIKDQEDAEIRTWTNELNDIDIKINEVDRSLFEPEL
ncbi:hypothetical protein KY304_01530 [Candidatus Woesearchaeota archaeon]|nr:hypothetical protein [Candidatus Woesearchaeota archaeon]MBW2978775.1 hypothetical protein [Candidatus Woesearchaeota archaeon]